MSKKIWWVIKCLFGFGSVEDGSICWFSKAKFLDAHDYPVHKGGDGEPQHWYTYTCHKCKKEFQI